MYCWPYHVAIVRVHAFAGCAGAFSTRPAMLSAVSMTSMTVRAVSQVRGVVLGLLVFGLGFIIRR